MTATQEQTAEQAEVTAEAADGSTEEHTDVTTFEVHIGINVIDEDPDYTDLQAVTFVDPRERWKGRGSEAQEDAHKFGMLLGTKTMFPWRQALIDGFLSNDKNSVLLRKCAQYGSGGAPCGLQPIRTCDIKEPEAGPIIACIDGQWLIGSIVKDDTGALQFEPEDALAGYPLAEVADIHRLPTRKSQLESELFRAR